MTDNKVSQKEIDKAMNSFMKNAAGQGMPSGMAVPFMAMMGSGQPSSPNAMPAYNPLMATQSIPQNLAQMNPYANMQQQQMYNGGQNGYKAVGLASRVRLGHHKDRQFGPCSGCSKMSRESTINEKGDSMEGYLWCNAKNKRVLPTSGLVTIDVEVNGKTEKQIDTNKSCRLFDKMDQ